MTSDEEPETNDTLKQRLIALGQSIPASQHLTGTVMDQIKHESPGASHPMRGDTNFRRWIMRGSIGLAACSLIGLFLWNVIVTPPTAYGIEDVRKQLGKVKSLHVAGNSPDGQQFEVFVQRPDRVYRVMSGAKISQSGEKNMVINDSDKSVMIMPGDPLDARYLVESVLQNELFTQLIGPPGETMSKIRTERVGDVEADVYEKKRGDANVQANAEDDMFRHEVFLNPRTGLPVKTVLYVQSPGEPEAVVATINKIEANGPGPKGAFDFAAPKGYQLREVPAQPKAPADTPPGAPAFAGSHSGDFHLESSYALNLGGKAILACWSFYDDRKPAEDLKLPTGGTMKITAPKGRYFEHLLRADGMPGQRHWRWSLFVPSDPSVPVTDNFPTIVVKAPKSILQFTPMPVTLPHGELSKFILDAQARTLPPGEKPLTLEEIEAKLKEASEKAL